MKKRQIMIFNKSRFWKQVNKFKGKNWDKVLAAILSLIKKFIIC